MFPATVLPLSHRGLRSLIWVVYPQGELLHRNLNIRLFFVREKNWDVLKDCKVKLFDNDILISLRSMRWLYLKQMALSRKYPCLHPRHEAGACRMAAGRNGLDSPALQSRRGDNKMQLAPWRPLYVWRSYQITWPA